ncbi:hypothetical protein EV363DRAFT_1402460 [Boletus edulis]|nr:hypothetical protein EV363DRAFT_1402460 [Boletus edulis]
MLEDSEELCWHATLGSSPVRARQGTSRSTRLLTVSCIPSVFRELLQNSDDAQSHTVEIHFETAAYLDRRKRREENLSVTQWTFKNNGEVFTEKDWMRLPKIAEGNPRPEKIGAFGVGFYSLFSVTECPFVSSGGHGMRFYWKDNDQLYVRRGNLPKRETPSPWTTFELPLREASPIPPPLEFMRFLASSITFMVNLRELGVFFDEHCIGCIKKFPGTIQPVAIPGELKRSSPLNMMNVIELQYHLELDQKLSMELLRSTKKHYSLIYTGKEEYDRSFEGLRADLNGLGHATGQTTGIGGHMASYFIPTVERESIDLVDRNIATWNEELVVCWRFFVSHPVRSGTLQDSRCMGRSSWVQVAGTLRQRFLHVLKFFTFHHSTPLSKVARLLEVAFYGCSTVPLSLLSSTGVRLAPEIKECNLAVAMFLKYLPMLPHYVIQECPRAVEALLARHKISPITLSDILQDLRTHVLTQEELVACLRWWMSQKNVSPQDTTRLLSAITIHSANGSPLQLSSVEYFVESEVSQSMYPLGWPTSYIPYDHDFTRSVQWAERVLGVLSGVWSSLSDKLRPCIPTSHGLCSPDESFLSSTNITLFQDLDLPIVHFTGGLEIQGEMEGFLLSIGVRKHVPPQLLLDNLVQDTLTLDELSRLESFVGFAEEGAQGDNDMRPRYRALDVLYPPLDIFRQLRLPVIDWSERWQNESDQDVTVRETAFKYLCDNLLSKYSHYNPDNFRHIMFIPAESKDGACLAKPGDVFLSNRWKALGFSVIQDSYRKAPVAELGAQQHPPPSTLIQLLETTPPTNRETARQWFECLCECISNFSQLELARLSELPIVPTRSSTGWQQMAPAQCYLNEGTRDDFHTKLFVFVDFGSTANRFLRACGSKSEPSVKDVAESLIEDPKRFYELAGGHEDFLAELRDLASQNRRIPNITLSKMMSRPILLGIRRKRALDGPDDLNSYQVFANTIFVAPQDVPGLEDFYMSLGCRRLSTVVEETYNASNEIRDPKTSTEVRTLIFERLPLFLRYAHTEFKVPVSLLRDENFKVKICERLACNVWAATNRDEEGRIELWLNNAELDMHEIAASLCRLLFGTARVNDTLLLATILSTPLEILKRRGYDVGKISKQHGQQPEDSDLGEEAIDSQHVPPVVTTTTPPNDAPEKPEVMVGPSIAAASVKPSTNRRAPGASEAPSGNTPSPAPLYHSVERVPNAPNNARGPIPNLIHRLILRRRASEAIPRANVNKAMNVCKPAGGKLLHHRNKVDDVRDFPNTGYCDVSGQVEQMKLRGKIGQVKVFTTEDVPDADTFMNTMHDVLTRFVDVLTPVAELYDLPLTLLHVFYDVAGGPIAFNRDRRIFLNLRYFEAWHDQDVQNSGPEQAQISWFFTLAHELAHNLIKEHNSEHVFWFAAICEAHVRKALARTSV